MLYALVIIGVVAILELYRLNSRLGDIQSEIKELKKELHWTEKLSFAENLREWGEEFSKDITDKIGESSKDISQDIAQEIKDAAEDLLRSLSDMAKDLRRSPRS